jgi:excinuclease ABC subunit A
VLFKGKSIADVLDMTVEEAADFFKAVPRVRDTFETLRRVGLDYIHVGQQATTLSGGEAQRVKLAKELSKRATGRTLYILDEPTTGLHFHDVKKLLEVLHELVAQGNTVVVIEHNLEVIKTADWVIDLGPEGGDGGGEIVAWGPPEDIVKSKRSYTGKFLEPVLKKANAPRKKSSGGGASEAAE